MQRIPDWLRQAVFYQIYPQSFYDTNGDGIGDIPGIVKQLDYLQKLGVTALWLNPCFVSPFCDAGYDVADYYRVAPRYGTNDDLIRLFREAHQRGIRVCLDLVAGHTSVEHPWFQASSSRQRNRYSDHFIWTRHVWDEEDPSLRYLNGYTERNGNVVLNFFWCQPALNYGFAKPNPKYPWQQSMNAPGPRAVRAEMRRVMAFWLERGCDGFRVDMACCCVKGDTPDRKANIALWRDMRRWMEKRWPEAVLVAEWGHPAQAIDGGYHVDFMLHCGVPGYPALFFGKAGHGRKEPCFFDRAGRGSVNDFLRHYLPLYRYIKGRGYISIPSGNHDFARIRAGREPEDLKVAFAFLLTWPGVPFLYYGDEIGMRYLEDLPSKEGGYARTGARTPMQWSRGRNAGFSTAPAKQLYLPIDPSADRPDVASQERDPGSLLHFVRRLTALRRSSPALQADGALRVLHAAQRGGPFVYLRSAGSERFLVAINPSGRSVSATLPAVRLGSPQPVIEHGVKLSEVGRRIRVSMNGVSYGVFRV